MQIPATRGYVVGVAVMTNQGRRYYPLVHGPWPAILNGYPFMETLR